MDYLFTFQNDNDQDLFIHLAHRLGIEARWVAVDPNPEYDHQWRFAGEGAFAGVITGVNHALHNDPDLSNGSPSTNDELQPTGGAKRNNDQDPSTHTRWTQEAKRELVHTAVTKWGYLTDQGLLEDDVRRDLSTGATPSPHAQNEVKVQRP